MLHGIYMAKNGITTDKIQFTVYFNEDLFKKLEDERGRIKRSTFLEMVYSGVKGEEACTKIPQ